jgi:hypothetical protein
MQIVGQAKQTFDSNNEVAGGFIGLALSIDSQYFGEMPIRDETLIFKLDPNFNIESVEKYVYSFLFLSLSGLLKFLYNK